MGWKNRGKGTSDSEFNPQASSLWTLALNLEFADARGWLWRRWIIVQNKKKEKIAVTTICISVVAFLLGRSFRGRMVPCWWRFIRWISSVRGGGEGCGVRVGLEVSGSGLRHFWGVDYSAVVTQRCWRSVVPDGGGVGVSNLHRGYVTVTCDMTSVQAIIVLVAPVVADSGRRVSVSCEMCSSGLSNLKNR